MGKFSVSVTPQIDQTGKTYIQDCLSGYAK